MIIQIFKSLHFLKRCPIFDTSPLNQFSNSIISFGYVYFYEKIFLILYTPFENSTTRIAIITRDITDQQGPFFCLDAFNFGATFPSLTFWHNTRIRFDKFFSNDFTLNTFFLVNYLGLKEVFSKSSGNHVCLGGCVRIFKNSWLPHSCLKTSYDTKDIPLF